MLARDRYQGLDVGLLAHIAAHGQTSKLFGQGLGALKIDVGDHHCACAIRGKTAGDAASNAAGTASDDDDLVPNPYVKVAWWLQAVC